jgi:4-coumarate--CoA ligase
MPAYTPKDLAAVIKEFKLTCACKMPLLDHNTRDAEPNSWLDLAPTIFTSLGQLGFHKELATLRFPVSGGGYLSPEVRKTAEKALNPGTVIVKNYGMTELACICCQTDSIEEMRTQDLDHGVGYLLADMEAKIIGSDGKEMGANEDGELHIRGKRGWPFSRKMLDFCRIGPTLTRGYYKNDEANQKAFKDGFLQTGDLARFDSKGRLAIVGRLKELIKVARIHMSCSTMIIAD